MYETVEMLCNKLGVVADELIPEIVAGHIAESALWLGIGVFGIVVVVVALVVAYFKLSGVVESFGEFLVDDLGWISVLAGVLLVVFGVIVVFNVDSLICWNIAPRAKAMQYIMSWVS